MITATEAIEKEEPLWLQQIQLKVRQVELEHNQKIEKLFHEIYGPKHTYECDMATYVARLDAFKEGFKWGNQETLKNLQKELAEQGLQITKATRG